MKPRHWTIHLALLATLIAGCTASAPEPSTPVTPPAGTPVTPPAGTTVVLVLQPLSATVGTGGAVPFTASVTGTADVGVTWTVTEGAPGGAVTSSGVYTAPSTAGTYHVVASSHADPTKTQIATVTVSAAPAIPVAPSSVALDACTSASFTASGAPGGTVTWSVREGASGGGVTAAGVYTAPSTPGTYHVVATGAGNPAPTGEATVTVGPEKVLGVAVSPGTGTVTASGTLALAATVTTTCGSFAAQ